MKRFRLGQLVLVHAVELAREIPLTSGRVVRLRRADDGAWVALDHRLEMPGVHPFPAYDERGTHVLAYPEYCEAI